ncbi:MAG: hypothetical protein JXB49_04950 [Bacteroidales bacterium]|nr:hypothetical protein [Bacteroidales bacterium]
MTVTYAQPYQTKLDQRVLVKQLLGNWKSDTSNDTNMFITNTLFKDGARSYSKFIVNGKIVLEEESIWIYNKDLDKFIVSTVSNGCDGDDYALWFTSEKKFIKIKLSDISNTDENSFKVEGEILSHEEFLESMIDNYNRHINVRFIKDRNHNPDGSRQNPKRDFPSEI